MSATRVQQGDPFYRRGGYKGSPKVCGAVEDIVVCEGPFFGDFQWRLASLPIMVGGLSLYSAVEAVSYAFVASRAQTWVLQDHILKDSEVCGMDSDFGRALDGLHEMIPSFDLSNFTRKDTVPHSIKTSPRSVGSPAIGPPTIYIQAPSPIVMDVRECVKKSHIG
ncbi:hypothetical protein A2U01_0015729, partial [Trifolium medium]|nr:hypothetical protein [Trifolium medium]